MKPFFRAAPALFGAAAALALVPHQLRAQAIFTTAPPELSRVILAPSSTPAPEGPPASVPSTEAGPHAAAAPAPDFPKETRPAAPAVEAAAEPETILRHLTNNIQGFRLNGEIASSEWPVYVTAAQAGRPSQFRLGYITAVSVMPEASWLTLTVNDRIVGRANIKAASSVRQLTFDVPANALQAGFNSVRLTAEQRHRADCSLEATYELWTQIDPSQTGFALARDAGMRTLADLAALSPDSQGALPIRAVTPAKASLASVERYIQAAQMISLVGRFTQPVIDYGPPADGEYGVNLVIAPAAEARRLIDWSGLDDVTGPDVRIAPARPGRRASVIVTGLDEAQAQQALNQALGELRQGLAAQGAPAGLRAAAAYPGYRMEGGQRVRLRDLGVASEEFSGRLFRASFNVVMPPDFYAADYGKAELALAGGYAPGLEKDSQIVVSVNGRNAVSLKLPKSNGDVFERSVVPLPLGSMRPGLNRVEIEAQVPMASDRACDPLAAISGAKRFLLLDTTELSLPRLARIARMPDLAVTTTGGFPFVGEKAPRLVLPSPDRETLGAATTIAAQLGIAGGKPIAFRLTNRLEAAGADEGAAMVIGAAGALDDDLWRRAGVDPAMVQKAWARMIDAPAAAPKSEALSRQEAYTRHTLMLERNFPASCSMKRPAGGFERYARSRAVDYMATASIRARAYGADGPSPPIDRTPTGALKINEPASGALYDEWNEKVRKPGAASEFFSDLSEGAGRWLGARMEGARKMASAAVSAARAPQPELDAKASLAIAQAIGGAQAGETVTLIAAPNSQALAEAAPCLVDPRVWSQVEGAWSTLDAQQGTIVSLPAASTRLIVTAPLTVGNMRLIAAGWLSIHSAIYVALAFALAGLLALATTRFVRSVGRRNP